MAALRNKRTLAAMNRENHEVILRSNRSRDTIVLRIQEDCITQVSEEIEGKVTKKLFQELSRTELSSERSVQMSLIRSELTISGALWTRSGDIPEFQ